MYDDLEQLRASNKQERGTLDFKTTAFDLSLNHLTISVFICFSQNEETVKLIQR